MNILIVDDDQILLHVISDFLTDRDYGVITAGDGDGALGVLESRSDVDLIVSDVSMPGMDGLALLKAVRVRYPGIPVILMTDYRDELMALAALHEGAADYLKKPIQLLEFLSSVEQVKERSQLELQVVRDYQGLVGQEWADELAEVPAEPAGQASILVVDGDRDTRDFVCRALSKCHHQVEMATTLEEGMQRFTEGLFDVVLVEADLADGDGVDLVRQMRALDPRMVSVILTSRQDREVVSAALSGGARGLVSKPFITEELVAAVDAALAERKRTVDVRPMLGDLIQVRSELRQKVMEKERFLGHLIDAAPFAVVSTDMQGTILTFNKQAETVYGYKEQQVVGSGIERLTGSSGDPQLGIRQGATPIRATHRNRDGQQVPVLVRCKEIIDESDSHVASLFVIEDLTEREQVEAQLLYAERLSLLGQLAPRIAHEFKTPLQLIYGRAEMAVMELDQDNIDVSRQMMKSVLPATEQITSLVNHMLNLGKPT